MCIYICVQTPDQPQTAGIKKHMTRTLNIAFAVRVSFRAFWDHSVVMPPKVDTDVKLTQLRSFVTANVA